MPSHNYDSGEFHLFKAEIRELELEAKMEEEFQELISKGFILEELLRKCNNPSKLLLHNIEENNKRSLFRF